MELLPEILGHLDKAVLLARVFLSKKIYIQKYFKKIKERAEKIIIGDPLDDKTQVGPLATKLQVERAEKIIAESIQQGAELIFGGKRLNKL